MRRELIRRFQLSVDARHSRLRSARARNFANWQAGVFPFYSADVGHRISSREGYELPSTDGGPARAGGQRGGLSLAASRPGFAVDELPAGQCAVRLFGRFLLVR